MALPLILKPAGRAGALLFLGLFALPARANLLSPGDLARPHAELEGLSNCTRCHVAGEKLAPEQCLDCHTELKGRMEKGQGYHGRLPKDGRACEKCHPDHQGRDFQMVQWGPGGTKGFAHAETGWPLGGKHAAAACEKCHQARLLTDPQVKKTLEQHPKKKTFLGAPTTCAACHFDEHRGQLTGDCGQCHGDQAFKPAKFDHARTRYPLEGKHLKVACDQCHRQVQDTVTPADAFPAPVRRQYVAYKDVPFGRCTDCHKDPHQDRFGGDCLTCHTLAGWKQLKGDAQSRVFHQKTSYPLEGAHLAVACAACHGKPPKYRGIPYARCIDCHVDGHAGQMADRAGRLPDCRLCHTVQAFKPPHFELEDHQKTRFQLEGSHRVVACSKCHPQDPSLADRLTQAQRRQLERGHRPERVSLARLHPADFQRCESCHTDPHGGQFPGKGCVDCHDPSTFTHVRFDHDKQSRYPLVGRHREASCAACHPEETLARGVRGRRYKPLDTTCAACHPDVHLGQFAAADGKTDCAGCHGSEAFTPARFVHAPPATGFELRGKHAKVACEKCHPEVTVAKGVKARRYTPLPEQCEGCHLDFHHGEFSGLAKAVGGKRGATGETHCADCHTEEGWRGAGIAHDRTGFPLTGAHLKAACRACHPSGFEQATSRRCAVCHRDVHHAELGARCEGCHDTQSWRPLFNADAHRRTNFPLTGRHAMLPCTECHQDQRDLGFSRVALDCYACHLRDYQRTALTSVDHAANGFSTACRDCHDPFAFRPARLPQHDLCFQTSTGKHSGISCLACHTSLSGTRFTGSCNTGTAACTRCHSCASTDRAHGQVPGYQCKERKCYECHRFSTHGG